jgi:crossover junction endodeoxyribonuclease RusA
MVHPARDREAQEGRGVIHLTLPIPPSINHYYGQSPQGRKFIKAPGVKYRQEVAEIVAEKGCRKLEGRITLFAMIHPADKRRQDLDNRSKALQDALTHAGVWLDDEQIDELHLVRGDVMKGGRVTVVITERDK